MIYMGFNIYIFIIAVIIVGLYFYMNKNKEKKITKTAIPFTVSTWPSARRLLPLPLLWRTSSSTAPCPTQSL